MSDQVPLTDDPEDDKYPHYYNGEEPSATIWSSLVYADEVPGFEDGTLGVGPWNERVMVDIEADGEPTHMSMSVRLTPDDARKAARSLLLSADLVERENE